MKIMELVFYFQPFYKYTKRQFFQYFDSFYFMALFDYLYFDSFLRSFAFVFI